MIKVYLLLITVLLFSCNKFDDCLEIRNKYVGNGQYYFELNDSSIFSGNGNGAALDEAPNPTAQVSEEDYNQYMIGDKYCRE